MKRKAQGALEYLFMIAAALIIIFVVVRYLTGSLTSATETAGTAASSATGELGSLMSEVGS